jgi:glycolate oxidase iron-sulfur subunit
MKDIESLVRLLGDLDDQLVTCMRCGMCQAVCPVFGQTGREADVSRGKLALLDGLAKEMLKNPEEVSERLERCLLCGSCEANCPSGVKVTDIFLKARAILTGYMGLSPAKKAIFRGMLTHPALFRSVLAIGRKFQPLFTKPLDDAMGASCARFMSPLTDDRRFKPLAAKPLRKTVSSLDAPRIKGGLKVAFFPGCLAENIFPEIALAVIKVLRHHDIGIFMPENQACCGIPAIANGDRLAFDELVRLNVKTFAAGDFDYLVTPCATCTSTIKKVWPSMYGQSSGRIDMRNLAAKTMDICAFLTDVAGVSPVEAKKGAQTVTYHDPCHLKNSLGVTAQPRALLKAGGKYAFTEMGEAGTCCGAGGSFNLKHYGLSRQIGMQKAQNVEESGANIVATACPACMLQLTDMLSRRKADVRVRHVVELYAESLDEQGNS